MKPLDYSLPIRVFTFVAVAYVCLRWTNAQLIPMRSIIFNNAEYRPNGTIVFNITASDGDETILGLVTNGCDIVRLFDLKIETLVFIIHDDGNTIYNETVSCPPLPKIETSTSVATSSSLTYTGSPLTSRTAVTQSFPSTTTISFPTTTTSSAEAASEMTSIDISSESNVSGTASTLSLSANTSAIAVTRSFSSLPTSLPLNTPFGTNASATMSSAEPYSPSISLTSFTALPELTHSTIASTHSDDTHPKTSPISSTDGTTRELLKSTTINPTAETGVSKVSSRTMTIDIAKNTSAIESNSKSSSTVSRDTSTASTGSKTVPTATQTRQSVVNIESTATISTETSSLSEPDAGTAEAHSSIIPGVFSTEITDVTTTLTTIKPSASTAPESSQPNAGVIVGISLGSLLAVLLLAATVACAIRLRNQKRQGRGDINLYGTSTYTPQETATP